MPRTIRAFPGGSVDASPKKTGVKLKSLTRGGHLSTEYVVQKYWPEIKEFFERK